MNEIPKVCEGMTHKPQTIDGDQPASAALALMDELNIRHLPVMHGSRVLGVVSERDLRLAENIQQKANITVTAGDLCSHDVYSVAPNTPLDQVLEHMVNMRIGSAVVIDAGYVVGIFTLVDACRGYKDLLRSVALRQASSAKFCG